MDNLHIFFSYFLITLIGFIGIAYIHSTKKSEILKNWAQFLIFGIAVSFTLTVLMILTNHEFGWHILFVLAMLGMVEHNVFLPILMKDIEIHITNRQLIATVALVNVIEYGLLYLILN